MTRRRTVRIAAATVLVLGVTVEVWAARSRQHRVRLEVDSRSGTVSEVVWYDGRQNRAGGAIPTPWSVTTTGSGFGGLITVAAAGARDDELTCRIIIDGETVATSTDTFATSCAHP